MYTGKNRRSGSLILLLAFAFAWISPAPARTAALAPSEPLPWTDDFSSSTLDPRWSITNEDNTLWSLTARPSYLRLTASGMLLDEPAGPKNLFLTSLPAGDFQATVVLETTPTRNGQGVGIILYSNPTDWILLHTFSNGILERVSIRQFSDGVATDIETIDRQPGITHLRLVVIGGYASAYFSPDGENWELVSEIPINSLQGSLGLMTHDPHPGLGGLVADIDSFSVEPAVVSERPWQNMGLYGGYVNQRFDGIVFDTATDDTYTCLPRGVYGLYRLHYGASAWEPVLTGGGNCETMAIDNTHHWIYRTRSDMLFRSQDSGASWQLIHKFEDSGPVLIHLPKGNPERILLAGYYEIGIGLDLSDDQGATWQPASFSPEEGQSLRILTNCNMSSLQSDPMDANWVYLSAGSRQPGCPYRGIYRSQDGGLNFTRIIEGWDTEGAKVNVGPTGIVFAGINSQGFRSFDHGDTWTLLSGGHGAFTFHPTQPNLIFTFFWFSDDYGDTWQYTGQWLPFIHPNHTDTYIYPGDFDYRISYDAGATQTPINTGIEEVQIWRMAFDPTDPQRIFIADQFNLGRTQDGGQTWDYPLLEATGYGVVIDPVNPEVVYALNWGGFGFKKSLDGGDTWNYYDIPPYPDSEIWENNLILNPNNTQVGYMSIATDGPPIQDIWGGVHKTVDGGETWTLIGLEDYPVEVVEWGWNNQELYAGVRTTWDYSRTGGVYRSQDGGATWQPIGLNGEYIQSLVIDPGHPGHLVVGTRETGIWKTEDYGAHWTQVLAGRFVYDLTLDPLVPGRVLAAINGGVYESLDAGQTWSAWYAYRPSMGVVYTVQIGRLNPTPRMQSPAEIERAVFIGNSRGLYTIQLDALQGIFLPLITK